MQIICSGDPCTIRVLCVYYPCTIYCYARLYPSAVRNARGVSDLGGLTTLLGPVGVTAVQGHSELASAVRATAWSQLPANCGRVSRHRRPVLSVYYACTMCVLRVYYSTQPQNIVHRDELLVNFEYDRNIFCASKLIRSKSRKPIGSTGWGNV